MNMSMERWWNEWEADILVGILFPSAGLSTTKLTWNSLGLNLRLYGQRPANNRLLKTDIHLNGM